MELTSPATGLRIHPKWATRIWISYKVDLSSIAIHMHFFPDTLVIRKKIYQVLYSFLGQEYQKDFDFFEQEFYTEHRDDDYGCFWGYLDRKNQTINSLINLEINNQRLEIKNFFVQIFNKD